MGKLILGFIIMLLFTANFCYGLNSPAIAGIERLNDWETVDELRAFLEIDGTDRVVTYIADENGKIDLRGRPTDRAIVLTRAAQARGKRLHIVPVDRLEFYQWFYQSVPRNTYYLLCGAIINDSKFYYINPENDQIRYIACMKSRWPDGVWREAYTQEE